MHMRLRPLFGLVCLALLSSVPPGARAESPRADGEEDRLVTRYGPVLLVRRGDGADAGWNVTLHGRVLIESETDELGLWELFEGDDDRDYVITMRSSGRIACPYQFRVIEAGTRGFVHVSEEFGSCLEPKRIRLHGNALVLDMPMHTPHPDLLTPAQVRKNERTTVIYTVRSGKVTRREELRK